MNLSDEVTADTTCFKRERTMATLIYADGKEKEVSPKNGDKFSLKELQEFVGGQIQIVTNYSRLFNLGIMGSTKNDIMLCNEEGLIHDLPINITSSVMSQDNIVGNIILFNSSEWD